MKLTHIILLLVIAGGVAALVALSGDFGSYSDFKDVMAKPDETHQIIGKLSAGRPLEYNPEKDPNYFAFYLVDKNGIEKKVVYHAPKPQDFERSEQIVLTGKMSGDAFDASEMLLKCPSKYKEKFTAEKK